MQDNPSLYRTLLSMLNLGQWLDARHLFCFADMLCGLIQSNQVSLTAWQPYSQSLAEQAQSHQRRFRRWLTNQRIDVSALYLPLLKKVLPLTSTSRVYLALDTTMLWDELCQARLVLVYRGRSIPLAWRTLTHASSMIAHEVYAPMLHEVASLFPNREVVLLADRGFGCVELLETCRQLGWHFRVRLKTSHHVNLHGFSCPLSHVLPSRRGHAKFLHQVQFTQQQFGPIYLALAKPRGTKEVWCLVSDEPTGPATFDEYGLRFDIEENFLDDKSNGFQWESSRFRCPEGIQRLTFVFAVATLYLALQGTQVVEQDQRRQVDPHWFRGYSYLRIGRQWVLNAIHKGKKLMKAWSPLCFKDPEPARASQKQYQLLRKKKRQRINGTHEYLDFSFLWK